MRRACSLSEKACRPTRPRSPACSSAAQPRCSTVARRRQPTATTTKRACLGEPGRLSRRQIKQEQQPVHDLVATGTSLLANKRGPIHLPATSISRPTLSQTERLIVLTGLTSNVSLNVARTIGTADDARLSTLIRQQIMLGGLGLLVFALLSWALVASTRRQSAHFRSLVTSTTDLVLAFTGPSCRYASKSVLEMLGRPERDVLDAGFVGLRAPRRSGSTGGRARDRQPPDTCLPPPLSPRGHSRPRSQRHRPAQRPARSKRRAERARRHRAEPRRGRARPRARAGAARERAAT